MGKDTWKQITKCTATLSTILSLRHNLLFALSDANNACLRADKDTSNNSSDDFRELIEAIYKIQSIIKYNENLDDVYDGNIVIKDIIEYIKHLVTGAQQSKAKSYAFHKIDNNSALWLHDFSQKIIPIKYCESQKEYFGKKGMTLHIDVFFYKLNGSIKKKVYMTAATRCDQGMSEMLGIADLVLREFKKEYLHVIFMGNQIMLVHIMVILVQRLYIKSVNLKELTLFDMITMSLAVAKISAIGKVQLQKTLFIVLWMQEMMQYLLMIYSKLCNLLIWFV